MGWPKSLFGFFCNIEKPKRTFWPTQYESLNAANHVTMCTFCHCVSNVLPSLRPRIHHLTTALSPPPPLKWSSNDRVSGLFLLRQDPRSYLFPSIGLPPPGAFIIPQQMLSSAWHCLNQSPKKPYTHLGLISLTLRVMGLCLFPNLTFHSLPRWQNPFNYALWSFYLHQLSCPSLSSWNSHVKSYDYNI